MKKTVFVVGAGASCEIKLPTGDDLKQLIIEALGIREDRALPNKASECLKEALQQSVEYDYPKSVELIKVANSVSRGLVHARSIDAFLDMHRDDQRIALCGKLAIAKIILDSERTSTFFASQRPGFPIGFTTVADTWYVKIGQLLFDHCVRADLPSRLRQVAFVVFNYDRCFEHYLVNSLQAAYPGMLAEEAAELVNAVEIHHPYGKVGSLEWMSDRTAAATPFGYDPSPGELIQLASKLRTFTESETMPKSEIAAVRRAMVAAKRVVFLGFSFLDLNMEFLYGTHPTRYATRVPAYATIYRMSPVAETQIYQRLESYGHHVDRHTLANETCGVFLSQYSNLLTFSH